MKGLYPRQKSRGALSTTSFMTKNVLVWRTPGNAISWSPWIRLKSAISPTLIFRKIVKVPGHEMAVEDEIQFPDSFFERCETLGCDRSRTTPTITKAPLSTLVGAIMA